MNSFNAAPIPFPPPEERYPLDSARGRPSELASRLVELGPEAAARAARSAAFSLSFLAFSSASFSFLLGLRARAAPAAADDPLLSPLSIFSLEAREREAEELLRSKSLPKTDFFSFSAGLAVGAFAVVDVVVEVEVEEGVMTLEPLGVVEMIAGVEEGGGVAEPEVGVTDLLPPGVATVLLKPFSDDAGGFPRPAMTR